MEIKMIARIKAEMLVNKIREKNIIKKDRNAF